jgi:hypothetical protein
MDASSSRRMGAILIRHRECAEDGCTTLLSIYNNTRDKKCSIHTDIDPATLRIAQQPNARARELRRARAIRKNYRQRRAAN